MTRESLSAYRHAMAKPHTIYSCQHCAAQSPKWIGRCPECGKWNTYVEERISDAIKDDRQILPPSESDSKIMSLASIKNEEGAHRPIGIPELDRVLGGGIVPGSLILLGGDPGIGKSTIILQALGKLADANHSILYISGEESPSQIKMRADRLSCSHKGIQVATENCIEKIFDLIKNEKFKLIVVDSIQTLYSNQITSAPGTISQVREAAGKFLYYAKKTGTAIFLIGHVTKDGSIAGPKVLEHMVDTVLYFEGERGHPFRLLRAHKNRFGGTNEIGVFEMTGIGLKEVLNPSELFLSERPDNAAGSVVIATQEGSRPLLVELQALVSSSGHANPRRTAIGIDAGRVALLIAIAEKILGFTLHDQDVFLNIAGGIKVNEPATDLGVIMAIASSIKNRAIDPDIVILGEVGLAGEVRAITGIEMRLKEIAKMGFKKVMLPKGNDKIASPKGIELFHVKTVTDAMSMF